MLFHWATSFPWGVVFPVYGSVLSLRFIVSWATISVCDFIITEEQISVKELVDLLENCKKMSPL